MHNRAKRIAAALLSVVMALTVFCGLTFTASADYVVGDTLEFGSYPQSKVTDPDLIAVLNEQTHVWKSYGYYSGTDTSSGIPTDGRMTASDYMQYCDVTYSGQKYRGVKFSQYRASVNGKNPSSGFSLQDNNGYDQFNHVYWFQYEPLQWRVLDPGTGLVLCDTIIDSQPFNNYIVYANSEYWGDPQRTFYASNYPNSSIRDWLTQESNENSFLNTAFTNAQRNRILNTTLDNSAYSSSASEYNCESTTDKVFLLSYRDVLNTSYGFSGSSSILDAARVANGSDYAKCQNLFVETNGGNDRSEWWLRSASASQWASDVAETGKINPSYNFVHRTNIGVRPAITLDLQSLTDMPNDTVSVTITDGIGVNFCLDFDAPVREGVDSATVTYRDFSGRTVTETYAKSDLVLQEDGRSKLTVWIAPAQLADEITVSIGDTEYTQSVLAYCDEIRQDGANAVYFPFLDALEQYWLAACDAFDYPLDQPMTVDGPTPADGFYDWTYKTADTTGKIAKISFLALTKPEFRFYMPTVTEEEAAACTVTASFKDGGAAGSLNARFAKNDQNEVLVEVTGLTPENLSRVVVVTIEGLGAAAKTIEFTGNDFAKYMFDTENNADLGVALYNCGAAAADLVTAGVWA